MHPTSIHITAVLVKWNTSTGRVQKGVATNWLATKNSEGTVYILFNKHNPSNIKCTLSDNHDVLPNQVSVSKPSQLISVVFGLCTVFSFVLLT